MKITNGSLLAFYNNIGNEDPIGINQLKSKKLSYAIDVVANRHKAEITAIGTMQGKVFGGKKFSELSAEIQKEWFDFLGSEIEVREHLVAEADLPDELTRVQRGTLYGLVIALPVDDAKKPEPAKPEAAK